MSVMVSEQLHAHAEPVNPAGRKPVERATNPGGDWVVPVVRDRMLRDFERGVSLRSIGRMYQKPVLAIEDALRERLRALEAAMRRAGVAVAAILAMCVGVDAFEAAMGHQTAVERSFRVRSRRSRRRRDEGAHVEAMEYLQHQVRETGVAA